MIYRIPKFSVIIIAGSNGFIRNTALEMYKAAKNQEDFSYGEYLLIAIPATLWPLPSYKAKDMLDIHSGLISASDDEDAKKAFRVKFLPVNLTLLEIKVSIIWVCRYRSGLI